MKNVKAFLPVIPLAYIMGACILIMDGWKISGWIFFTVSILFAVIVIGINLQNQK